MPKVTIRPSRAAATAAASARCRAGTSRMAASAAIIHSTASGSCSATSRAAAAIAGAELRPTGSSTMRGEATPARRNSSATRNRCSWLHTTIGGAKPSPSARRAVSSIIERSEISGQNCLGKLARETGHRREPEPPDNNTGTTSPTVAKARGAMDEPVPGVSTFMLDPHAVL